MASPKDKALAVEEPTLRMIAEIIGNHILPALVVNGLQSLMGNRDELALVIGRTRRLGVPSHRPRPEHVAFSVAHTVDVAFQFFVGVDRNVLHEIIIGPDCREQMFPSVFGVFRPFYKVFHDFPLDSLSLLTVSLKLLAARLEVQFVYYISKTHSIFSGCLNCKSTPKKPKVQAFSIF